MIEKEALQDLAQIAHDRVGSADPSMDILARGVVALSAQLEAAEKERNAAWFAIEHGWDIEPRSYFEKEAPTNGFGFPLAQAVHHMWKRELKERDGQPIVCRKCIESKAQLAAVQAERDTLRTRLSRLHAWNSNDMQIRHRQVVLASDLLAVLDEVLAPAARGEVVKACPQCFGTADLGTLEWREGGWYCIGCDNEIKEPAYYQRVKGID